MSESIEPSRARAHRIKITPASTILAVLGVLAIAAVVMALAAYRAATTNTGPDPVVGAWFVTAKDAPFSHHMFVFHSDGTVGQANPDAGNATTSDSDGAGVWRRDGDMIVGKFVEATADRATHQFVSRGEVSFRFTVTGDTFSGAAEAQFYDIAGNHLRGPLGTPLDGARVAVEPVVTPAVG